jgi:hypothetical protein
MAKRFLVPHRHASTAEMGATDADGNWDKAQKKRNDKGEENRIKRLKTIFF